MNTNITEKKYKKLSIQIGLHGFSFCCFDTLNQTITNFKEFHFEDTSKKIEDELAAAFIDFPELKEQYDSVLVIHNNTFSTFVPTPFFDENNLGSYLQYNTKVFQTDFFAFEEIKNCQMNAVFIPFLNINELFSSQFGSINYTHSNAILVSKLLIASKNITQKKVYVHLDSNHFEIIVVQNQKLLLFNNFEYIAPEDLLYYILFTAEQLNLNPEEFPLEFLGKIDIESEHYKLIYKYIRNVSLYDTTELQLNNSFSETENRANFILFNS